MIDNWNSNDGSSGYHTEIMEGPHGGGGPPWLELSLGEKFWAIIKTLLLLLFIWGLFYLVIMVVSL